MKIIKNHLILGARKKPILIDFFYPSEKKKMPVVIFCHGYKGYKDWGAWELVAKEFCNAGFLFVKFNFSHNGGTPEQPIDFPDLKAFGENTYSLEMDDLGLVIDWLFNNNTIDKTLTNTNDITLIGHSRGGGIAILKTNEDERITKLITWAAISNIGVRFPAGEELEVWKKTGVRYVKNGRTKQDMPHYFSFYEDYRDNKDRLDIESAAKNIEKPFLIIHGSNDKAVGIHEAMDLHKWNNSSQLELIENGGHTFGSKHPWTEETLPPDLDEVVRLSIEFISK